MTQIAHAACSGNNREFIISFAATICIPMLTVIVVNGLAVARVQSSVVGPPGGSAAPLSALREFIRGNYQVLERAQFNAFPYWLITTFRFTWPVERSGGWLLIK